MVSDVTTRFFNVKIFLQGVTYETIIHTYF